MDCQTLANAPRKSSWFIGMMPPTNSATPAAILIHFLGQPGSSLKCHPEIGPVTFKKAEKQRCSLLRSEHSVIQNRVPRSP